MATDEAISGSTLCVTPGLLRLPTNVVMPLVSLRLTHGLSYDSTGLPILSLLLRGLEFDPIRHASRRHEGFW